MPADPDLDRLRNDVIARALKQYESRSETLAKSVNGLVLFAFLFFFLILFPFISLHQQRHRIGLQLQGIPEQIRLIGSSLAGYRALADGLAGVKSSIKQGPFELRAAIQRRFAEPLGQQRPTQQSPIQQGPQQPAPVQQMDQTMPADNMAPNGLAGAPACGGAPASTEWMNCQVRRQVDRQFAGYAAQLESSVIEPAQRLPQAPGSAGPLADSTRLRQALGKIQQAFLQRLGKEPEFWKTFGARSTSTTDSAATSTGSGPSTGSPIKRSNSPRCSSEPGGNRRTTRPGSRRSRPGRGCLPRVSRRWTHRSGSCHWECWRASISFPCS